MQAKASSVERTLVAVLPSARAGLSRKFGKALGVDKDTVLLVLRVGDHLEIEPLVETADVRIYTDEELAEFLEADVLDSGLAEEVRAMLGRAS